MRTAVVVGSGAREHALAWGLTRDGVRVVVTPGNAGIEAAGIECTTASPLDIDADLYVIGPEVPLVAGLADHLRSRGKVVFGPGADGAALEGSKAYMKEFLASANVATASFGSFDDAESALKFVRTMSPPYVIKTDGLAAGKGVLVTNSLQEAEADIADKISGSAFGPAGSTVVIEEGLKGVECSLLVISDGKKALPLIPARDHKRVGDGDTGPNTGGMGAFAPLDLDDATLRVTMSTIIEPTMRELSRRGIDFRGVLYAGLMLTDSGPQLLEYNVRFGDPETEVIIPLLSCDLFDLLDSAARGDLATTPTFLPAHAVTVVLAAAGYPEAPRRGDIISGLDSHGQLELPLPNVTVFHAGTERDPDGNFVTAGGRVLAVTAVASSLDEARRLAYTAQSQISFDGKVLRSDIALGD